MIDMLHASREKGKLNGWIYICVICVRLNRPYNTVDETVFIEIAGTRGNFRELLLG